MTRFSPLPLLAGLILSISGCTKEGATTSAPAGQTANSPFRVTATIQDLMDAEVDPAADFIWGSTAIISTQAGTQDKRPRTDQEWEVVRNNAITLIEATNLLVIPGRKVATMGSKLDPEEVAGIESPEEIEKAITANWDAFVGFAHGLHDAGMEALAAINAKDIDRLEQVGEKLDLACEQCHRTFWYPNAPEPIQTLEPPKP